MSKKVLIIEDHDALRANVSEILRMALYTVIEADNGKEGVKMALEYRPDIILCDIMMPELDGYGVLYMLGKHVETSSIPFIFLTAKAEHGDLRKGMELGADDYLIKPFDGIELLNAVDTRLKKKAAAETCQTSSEELNTSLPKMDGLTELNKIIGDRKSREFKKNQIIYYEGDHGKGLYMVIQGRVKTIKLTQDGRELMTGMYLAGDYLGVNTVLSGSPYTDTATAVEDSLLVLVPIEEMESLFHLYPDVARKFIQILSKDNREKEDQLVQLAYHSVRKKMAGTIVKLYYKNHKDIVFSITREDLAAMACMANETVSRTLSDFKDEKLIDRTGTKITVLNLEGLSKMKN